MLDITVCCLATFVISENYLFERQELGKSLQSETTQSTRGTEVKQESSTADSVVEVSDRDLTEKVSKKLRNSGLEKSAYEQEASLIVNQWLRKSVSQSKSSKLGQTSKSKYSSGTDKSKGPQSSQALSIQDSSSEDSSSGDDGFIFTGNSGGSMEPSNVAGGRLTEIEEESDELDSFLSDNSILVGTSCRFTQLKMTREEDQLCQSNEGQGEGEVFYTARSQFFPLLSYR